jgi:RsiW-degrading membrane proteinase PrsW (M82 family)
VTDGDRSLPPPPNPAAAPPAGWYADPVRGHGWRWWNGWAWTTFTEQSVGAGAAAGGTAMKPPRLPRWLSVPVTICAPLVLLGVVGLAVADAVAVLAGLVPLAIVLPAVAWIDRVEPEPRASRAHAVLWGASVAILGAFVVNTAVAVLVNETAAVVLSAPIVEEALKALGIVWAVRRHEVDGVSDGIVYAAWVALGFAVVEDMLYFADASVQGAFLPVFVLRALLTPFAHPLFTFWVGLAVGLAVARGRPLWTAWWGYLASVVCHMAWNGALSIGDIATDVEDDVEVSVILGMAALFLVLFVAVAVALVVLRKREAARFIAGVPAVVARHGISPDEAAMFASWGAVLAARRALPRARRRQFDRLHAAIARLVALEQRPGTVDEAAQAVLGEQLRDARVALWRDG